MPSLHVAPTMERFLVTRRGSFSVPRDVATINCDCAFGKPCRGIALNSLAFPHHALELVARERAKMMVARLALRDQRLLGDLWLHGPWASYLFEERLANPDSSAWQEAAYQKRDRWLSYDDPSKVLGFVFERDPRIPVSDYLLVGNFSIKAVPFDEPMTVEVK